MFLDEIIQYGNQVWFPLSDERIKQKAFFSDTHTVESMGLQCGVFRSFVTWPFKVQFVCCYHIRCFSKWKVARNKEKRDRKPGKEPLAVFSFHFTPPSTPSERLKWALSYK